MAELGYIDGQNLIIEHHDAQAAGDDARSMSARPECAKASSILLPAR